jgi:AcrR family transcriptional regulator
MRNLQHSRDDVLRVAEDLFTAQGPHGLSVRRIAESLGVSRQIVYSRFRGKPDLVRALHAEGFHRLSEQQAAVQAEPGSTAHVLALGHAYRNAALASPALFDLMFGRPVADFEPDESARSVALGTFTPVVAAAGSWLAAHVERSSSASDDAHGREAADTDTEADADADADAEALRLAREVWAVTHGVVSLETAGLLGPDVAPTMLDDVLTAVLVAAQSRHCNAPVI